ncbi:extracellular solute-binding protein [Burkholderia sp. Ax-1724]|uniref:ABC transporter substrate-binding protein n=1 Tax=Burkholderia sp. Ax-1724 TaxID=2608336 RepID=UPI0019645274|nr:extracellular solute-binding protein [Burkholderia sp. Ax-1724]
MMRSYRALTWDHPRGYDALAAAASARADVDGVDIQWEKQPLEGFESHPIEELCSAYDIVVLDHPHLGEAVARGCLQPLEALFEASDIAQWQAQSIGPSLRSYQIGGQTWALPLDAAAQVMACRPDLLDAPPPATWADVIDLPAATPVALSLAGPHAILTFMSIAATLGEPIGSLEPGVFVSEPTGRKVLDVLRALYRRTAPETIALNPIRMLDLMSSTDRLALCPLIFGYVNYSRGATTSRAVRFADVPTFSGAPSEATSVIGGTGIALSTRCEATPALLAHLRWLLSEPAQREFIPQHAGQPSHRAAWHDGRVNELTHGFFERTSRTLEQSWVRPRFDGYIAFQTEASAMVRDALARGAGDADLLNGLQSSYRQCFKPV